MEIPDNETENIASSQHFLCIPISGYKGLKIQFQNLNKVGDKTENYRINHFTPFDQFKWIQFSDEEDGLGYFDLTSSINGFYHEERFLQLQETRIPKNVTIRIELLHFLLPQVLTERDDCRSPPTKKKKVMAEKDQIYDVQLYICEINESKQAQVYLTILSRKKKTPRPTDRFSYPLALLETKAALVKHPAIVTPTSNIRVDRKAALFNDLMDPATKIKNALEEKLTAIKKKSALNLTAAEYYNTIYNIKRAPSKRSLPKADSDASFGKRLSTTLIRSPNLPNQRDVDYVENREADYKVENGFMTKTLAHAELRDVVAHLDSLVDSGNDDKTKTALRGFFASRLFSELSWSGPSPRKLDNVRFSQANLDIDQMCWLLSLRPEFYSGFCSTLSCNSEIASNKQLLLSAVRLLEENVFEDYTSATTYKFNFQRFVRYIRLGKRGNTYHEKWNEKRKFIPVELRTEGDVLNMSIKFLSRSSNIAARPPTNSPFFYEDLNNALSKARKCCHGFKGLSFDGDYVSLGEKERLIVAMVMVLRFLNTYNDNIQASYLCSAFDEESKDGNYEVQHPHLIPYLIIFQLYILEGHYGRGVCGSLENYNNKMRAQVKVDMNSDEDSFQALDAAEKLWKKNKHLSSGFLFQAAGLFESAFCIPDKDNDLIIGLGCTLTTSHSTTTSTFPVIKIPFAARSESQDKRTLLKSLLERNKSIDCGTESSDDE